MGTWGTDIFADDLAADVRTEWRILIGDGLSSEEATRQVVAQHADLLSDDDVRTVFWVALALTQHRAGRMDPSVRAEALRQIDNPHERERWSDDPKLLRRRLAILERAQTELLSVPPAPRRIRKVYRSECEWEVGDLIAFELRSGNWTLFRVVDRHTDLGGTAPVVEVLDWTSATRPSSPPRALEVRRDVHETWPTHNRVRRIMIGATNARQRPNHRLYRIGKDDPASFHAGFAPSLLSLWPQLDETLERHFGLT